MTWELAAPAAVDSLVTKAQTITGPDVHDSIVVTASGNPEAVIIAGSADPQGSDQHYIEHKPDSPGYHSDVEDTFTIWNEIVVLAGGGGMAGARSRCYQILDAWGQQIADDPTLDDSVMQAWIGEVGYKARQTPRGAVAALIVAVDCEAFTGT